MNPETLAEILTSHKKWVNHKKGGKRADLRGANLSCANLRDANLRGANLSCADLRRANLVGANLDFASWPLWCGSTGAVIDTRLSLQLIYHTFNQDHQNPEIRKAIEFLRPLAQRFKDEFRQDATSLRPE